MRVMANPRFVNHVNISAKNLVAFFDEVAVFLDWHNFVGVANDVRTEVANRIRAPSPTGAADQAGRRMSAMGVSRSQLGV